MTNVRLTLALIFTAWGAPAMAADLSAKAYVEYKKATISLTPTKAALDAAKDKGLTDPSLVTYHPNVVPSVGGGLDLYGLGGSYSVSLPQSTAEREARGETKYTHSEIHVSRWSWVAFDVRREHYEGFFRRTDPLGKPEVFGDSLFKSGANFEKSPDMNLTWTGATATFGLNARSLPLSEAVSTTAHPHRSGWTPLLMLTANKIEVSNSEPLVPSDQEDYFGDDSALTGGVFMDAGILPGLGFTLASEHLFLTMLGGCGLSWQTQEFTGIDRNKAKMRGTACDLRGSLGYSTKGIAVGILGYKAIQTITAETVNVSPASSSVQTYLSVRL